MLCHKISATLCCWSWRKCPKTYQITFTHHIFSVDPFVVVLFQFCCSGLVLARPGFYSSTLIYSRFAQRFSFFTACLVQGSVGWSHGRHQMGHVWNSDLQVAGKYIILRFFLELGFMGSFKEKLARKINATFLYACCK